MCVGWRYVSEYVEYLRRHGIDPDRKYTVSIEVSELELNALEDLLFTNLSPAEQKVVEDIVRGLWQKLVSAVDRSG